MQTIEKLLYNSKIGTPQHHKNLTLFPISLDYPRTPDYITLDKALNDKHIRITEISETGSVPELKLVNESTHRVLLLDGEELKGAKQNRVVNLSILVDAGQTLTLPVSCVEARRWSHNSREFSSSGNMHFAGGRAKKMENVTENMVTTRSRYSNQQEVWQEISEKSMRMRATSRTDAMEDVFRAYDNSVDEYTNTFEVGQEDCGAVFAIDGKIIGFDLFDSPDTYEKLLPKLVRSYALDALESQPCNENTVSTKDVEAFLRTIGDAQFRSEKAIGLGEDVRIVSDEVTGGGLLVDGELVHLTAFQNVVRSRRNFDDEDFYETPVQSDIESLEETMQHRPNQQCVPS